MRDYKSIYESWLSDPYFDEETKAELRAINDNDKEIMERFAVDLEFGTAGLRGIIGAGTNRMNKYVIRRATQGLCDYINSLKMANKGVVIAYDSRHMSPEFSDEAARTLAANGIKAYRFESLRPTPELSFAVRKLGCIAGINITASHNSSEYNGYKVYWEDGAQFTPPHDKAVTEAVLSISDLSSCKTMDKEAAEAAGLYITIGSEIDDAYIECVKSTIIDKAVIKKMQDGIGIVYTPLHGTGHKPVMRILKELGFTHVYEVPEQAEPDGAFPTVNYPNPESKAAFELALKLAEEKRAELVLATDPDADRLGVYAKDSKTGKYMPFTGNMSGTLICEYLLSQKKKRGELKDDSYVVESIVSTDMMKAVAKEYDCELKEVLTGFKWIGREILESEKAGHGHFEFGMEESYGCLTGTYARDKDAVAAVAMLCEAACYYKQQGKTLWDVMQEMYEHYGYYAESIDTVELKGLEGTAKIKAIMEAFRNSKPEMLSDFKVLKIRDYENGTITVLSDGSVIPTGLPKSNVMYFELDKNSWVCARPSGTEPKLKIYAGVKGDSEEHSAELAKKLHEDIRNRFID